MEDKRNEMLMVTVYADDTGLFTEEECDRDNTVSLVVPKWILEIWYKDARLDMEYNSFEDWMDNYIFDDFITFYSFCIIKGIIPDIDVSTDIMDKVIYKDDDDKIHTIFEGTYNECRRFGKTWNWSYAGYDLMMEIE